MTIADHLKWTKRRAIEYVERGDVDGAWASFISDMGKHEETARHPVLMTGNQMFVNGMLDDPAKMRAYIEGYN